MKKLNHKSMRLLIRIALIFFFLAIVKATPIHANSMLFFLDYSQKHSMGIEDTIMPHADKMPEFPGGNEAMMEFLGSRIRYPSSAVQKGISGRVFVQFVVTQKGKITNIKILKGLEKGCNDEAIRLVKLFPDWTPGQHNGKSVSVYYTIPISFRLEDNSIRDKVQMPEFPGGTDSLNVFLSRNFKYPEEALKKNIEGIVRISFAVDIDGKIKNIKIVQKIDTLLVAEALRLISLFPRWNPALYKGKPLELEYSLDFKFFNGHELNHDEVPLQFVEQMPEFPGGQDAMMRYLAEHIRYPELATKMGVTGRVIVQFVVRKDGSITNIKVLRKIGAGCDEEAVRVLASMPPWNPGRLNGKIVPVYFTLPVVFQLKQ